MPRKPDPHKTCRYCKKVMRRKEFSGRVEDLAVFRHRRYCDRACMARAFIKINPTLAGYRVRARKFIRPTCEVCEGTEKLSVHHLDENVKNNAPGNVWTLCNSCHQIWHWHFGKGRRRKTLA